MLHACMHVCTAHDGAHGFSIIYYFEYNSLLLLLVGNVLLLLLRRKLDIK